MFIKELLLNTKYLEEQILTVPEMDTRTSANLRAFGTNLLKGIGYYCHLSAVISCNTTLFEEQLNQCEEEIKELISRLEEASSPHLILT